MAMSDVVGSRLGLIPAGCLLLAGCAIDAGDAGDAGDRGERLGAADDAIVLLNSVNLNSINLNSINLNSVNLNSVNLNALDPAALNPTVRAAVEDPGPLGAQAREALRYIVGCALPASTSFDFSWTDSAGTLRQESYPGLLGLAPTWANAPASNADTGWLSACLISRANRYGTPVEISSRGGHGVLAALDQEELDTYNHMEGAFWGDLFASPPVAYSCSNPAEVAHARQLQRDCASGAPREDGGVDGCGMIQMVGSCADRCTKYNNPKGYYSDCSSTAGGPESSQVITVYLE